ncbi:dipeptide epimerase [Alsobacter metallidurans]|uniref:Dipeptide epimerase n=1 Tax=Alsobacter metallidurans TaxID=340221 RepID=A0A917IAN9_9HYPH|nr:N-acetyl-D-Glu racemase DgcA [Alsobacter metallidurans]GGH26687.1 dipeptide epimerase [Alsobacter metallidurans]
MPRSLSVAVERFPIAGAFTIARGSRTEAVVVTATIGDRGVIARGECVPYARYGESVESVTAQIEAARAFVEGGGDRHGLLGAMPAGAARNAVDCALWDLEAKTTGVPAHVLAGLDRVAPATTCFTISLGAPDAMAEATAKAADRPILKIKLGGGAEDGARIAAVRRAAPDAVLVVDANEGWREHDVAAQLAACAAAGVALVEQPLPAGQDDLLASLESPIPLCADESAHGLAELAATAERYDAINIKLDKTGGLTAALELAAAARAAGLDIMVGCMVGTSLAMAPAMLLSPGARYVDLDGPLLLARDREPGLRYEGGLVFPPSRALWG